MSNQKNGMITRFWGPLGWSFIHTTAMGYPLIPTQKNKKEYKRFYNSLKNILPCGLCRNSFKDFLKEIPLTDKVLSSRKSLFNWTCAIHNRVNKKLNVKELTKNEIKSKYKFYENFRAKNCVKNTLGCTIGVKKNQKRTELHFGKTKTIISFVRDS